MRTEMDYLIIENFVMDKSQQPEWKKDTDWQDEFELD
jgi:carbamoyltransferase